MEVNSAALLLVTTCLLAAGVAANLVPRESKTFMDVFNIVRLNPAARLGIGLQITFPISTFMPDLGIFGRQSRSHSSRLKQKLWPYKSMPTCTSREVSIEDYLHLMHINDEACQERFICEMSSDPKKFMPLSEILLKKLSFHNKWMPNSYASNLFNTTEYNLYQAAQVGIDVNQECQYRYWNCPVAATSMINMDLLWGWQVLSSIFNIMYIGETQANV